MSEDNELGEFDLSGLQEADRQLIAFVLRGEDVTYDVGRRVLTFPKNMRLALQGAVDGVLASERAVEDRKSAAKWV